MLDEGNDANAQPLRGAVLCSTSLSQELRGLLSDIAERMGATHRLDLTADVTHLIVGNIDTPKYRHTAKERPDIHVLKPEWIHAIRQVWRDGQDVDVDALVREYRLPSFYNLHVCVTGFDDVDQRQELMQAIGNNGAFYHGDLTRDVTHLIAAKPKGAKYERAKAWDLKIVSLKWLEESLDRGMALEESLYHPLMPSEDQGQGAYVRGYQKPQLLGKRRRDDAVTSLKQEAGKRRLRRTASTRLGGHSQNLLADISFAEDDSAATGVDQWTETKDEASDPHPSRKGTPSIFGNSISRPASAGAEPLVQFEEEHGLFSRVLCHVHGHDAKRTAKINEIIASNGGELAQSPEDLFSASDVLSDRARRKNFDHTVLIIPSEWTSITKGSLPRIPAEAWHVTEWWLERCIKQKTIIDPKNDVLSRPHLDLPINGFQGMSITTSGMGSDVMHISKLVRIAGATYNEMLVPKTSVLVIPTLTANAEKTAYAAKHNIPVVSEKWLLSSIAQAQKLHIPDYAPTTNPKDLLTHQRPSRPQSREGSAIPQREKRKDNPLVQRLSVTRKRSLASSLQLVKSGSTKSAHQHKPQASRKGPFIEEDAASDDGQSDGPQEAKGLRDVRSDDQLTSMVENTVLGAQHTQQPVRTLQDLPPEMNSSRGQSNEMNIAEAGACFASPAKPSTAQTGSASTGLPPEDENGEKLSAEPAKADKQRLQGDIKSLLEWQHSAPALAETTLKGRWRKERKLGRALSVTSNSSTSVSFRQSASMDMLDSNAPANLADIGVPMPSQQLTYETLDAQEYQAKMSKKIGTRLMDDSIGTRVESPGVVRDVETSGNTGVGGRVRGRHRSAKNQS